MDIFTCAPSPIGSSTFGTRKTYSPADCIRLIGCTAAPFRIPPQSFAFAYCPVDAVQEASHFAAGLILEVKRHTT